MIDIVDTNNSDFFQFACVTTGHQRSAGTARYRGYLSCDHRGAGPSIALDSARQLMGYCGAVPSEDSSGKRTRRGGITKTGNASSTLYLVRITQATGEHFRRDEKDCASSADPNVSIIQPAVAAMT